MRIGVLDDDEAQIDAVTQVLTAAGNRCQTFKVGKTLISSLRRESFDLLILDWNLPDMTGPDVIGWARENLQTIPPILLLTCRSSEGDVVTGLNAGADDFVVKPVQPAVLLARVNALLRRAYSDQSLGGLETFGDYAFSPPSEAATVRGEPVPLTAKEFGLALLLFRNAHRALSRSYILESVWGRNPDLPTRTLDMHISKIRAKLNLRPENGFRLAPVYSYGYRLERLDGGVDAIKAVAS